MRVLAGGLGLAVLLAAAALADGPPAAPPQATDVSPTSVSADETVDENPADRAPADASTAAADDTGFVEPRALAMVSPSYPVDAVDADLQGSVVVCFTVTAAGSVVDAYVLSSTHEMFEAPAVRAAGESTFEPATQTGEPVSHDMCLRYRYRL